MRRSLSALLPVRNVESKLASMVLEMLEILPELSSRIELVVIDDGSSDSTIEVADDLCGRYPQLRAVGHTRPQGRSAAIATGLARSQGETIFLPDEDGLLAISDIQKMWTALSGHDVVLGRPSGSPGGASWRRRGVGPRGGFVLGDRAVLEAVRPLLIDHLALRSHLLRHNHCWHEIEIASRVSLPAPHRWTAGKALGRARKIDAAVCLGVDSGGYGTKPKAPNYLTRLRDFALGE